jgi:hypothetical protein
VLDHDVVEGDFTLRVRIESRKNFPIAISACLGTRPACHFLVRGPSFLDAAPDPCKLFGVPRSCIAKALLLACLVSLFTAGMLATSVTVARAVAPRAH